jgi:hypothetical protein
MESRVRKEHDVCILLHAYTARMSEALKPAQLPDGIPTTADSSPSAASKRADLVKSTAIARFQSSTTDILSPAEKAAFKLRSKRRSAADAVSAIDSIQATPPTTNVDIQTSAVSPPSPSIKATQLVKIPPGPSIKTPQLVKNEFKTSTNINAAPLPSTSTSQV